MTHGYGHPDNRMEPDKHKLGVNTIFRLSSQDRVGKNSHAAASSIMNAASWR